MPEGPEVETVRRSLAPLLEGRSFGTPWVSRMKLRTPVTTRQLSFLDGRRVLALGRHGKLMWLDVVEGGGLLLRLGMTGKLLVEPHTKPRPPHTHVVLPLDDGASELRYVDVRRFGEVVPFTRAEQRDEERARLGPDPLSWTKDERSFVVARLKATKRSLKDALLDQSVVAGVGNIYACEALFTAGLSPLARGSSVSRASLEGLTEAVQQVLETAVLHRGTTFSDFVDADGERGQNLAHVHVFQREGLPCPRCTRPVERIVQGARSTFLCRRCQPARARPARRAS